MAHLVSYLPKGVLTDPAFVPIYERRGIHITPAQYYYPIPMLSELGADVWTAKSSLVGIDMRPDEQAALLDRFRAAGYFSEYRDPPRPGFGGVDGRMLYAMIRDRRPRRFIEIGSGSSTLIARQALADNGDGGTIVAIEPFEAPWLEEELAGSGSTIRERVERVPLSVFEAMEAGDILFIDSSHTVKVGGDVVHEINEILPRLPVGVAIHLHDIGLPFNYQPTFKYWAEQYLLQAFLAFNPHFRVLFGYAYLQETMPEALRRNFPGVYVPDVYKMGCFWIERVS